MLKVLHLFASAIQMGAKRRVDFLNVLAASRWVLILKIPNGIVNSALFFRITERDQRIKNCALCFVCIGSDFASSLLITSMLKDMGAARVVAKASQDIHAKLLLRNGADAVAYPEKQLAKWAAIRYTANHIFSYIELDEQHAIIEVAVPEDWQGRSIGELDIRRKYGVNILGVKRNGKTDVNISPEIILDGSLTLLVLGENKALKKQFRL